MSCSGPEPNQCTQCEKGLVLDPNTLLCGVMGDTDCPTGTYLHDDHFTCMGCHRHCYSCEGPGNDECQTCAVPKYLHSEPFLLLSSSTQESSSGCKTNQSDRTWFKKKWVFMQLYLLCVRNENSGSDIHFGYGFVCFFVSSRVHEWALINWEWNFVSMCYFPDSSCVSECPAGTYDTRQEADGKELGFCLRCDTICSTCTGASPRDCLTCSPGYLHLLDTCVNHCPTG